MKKALLGSALALAIGLGCIAPALAQTYKDTLGTIVPATVPLNCPVGGGTCYGPGAPYGFTHLGGGQYALAIVSATSLTVPAGAFYATIQANTATVFYTTSGTTPTSSVGNQLTPGSGVFLSGADVLASFKAISATGTITVEYFK